MQRIAATEQERIKTPFVWLGHKKCRPAKTTESRQGWSVEDMTEGSLHLLSSRRELRVFRECRF